jgi:hypothetical protein
VDEDTSLTLPGISFADNDSLFQPNLTYSVTLATTGSGSLNGSTDNLVLTGTLADINTALETVSYQAAANFFGSETISVTVDDQSTSPDVSANIVVTVGSVDDVPELTAPATLSVNEDTLLNLPGISFSDNDSLFDPSVTYSVTLATSGSGALNGSTADLVLSGTLADINTALSTVTYQGAANFFGDETISVTVDDQTTSPDVSKNIVVTVGSVDDIPVITAPATLDVDEDTALTLPGISFADNDSLFDPSVTYTVTVATSGNGTLNGGIGDLVLSGTLADINTALSTVSYQGATNFFGEETVSITVDDQTSSPDVTENIVISVASVDDTPQITTPATLEITEDTSLLLTGISFSDNDSLFTASINNYRA